MHFRKCNEERGASPGICESHSPLALSLEAESAKRVRIEVGPKFATLQRRMRQDRGALSRATEKALGITRRDIVLGIGARIERDQVLARFDPPVLRKNLADRLNARLSSRCDAAVVVFQWVDPRADA